MAEFNKGTVFSWLYDHSLGSVVGTLRAFFPSLTALYELAKDAPEMLSGLTDFLFKDSQNDPTLAKAKGYADAASGLIASAEKSFDTKVEDLRKQLAARFNIKLPSKETTLADAGGPNVPDANKHNKGDERTAG